MATPRKKPEELRKRGPGYLYDPLEIAEQLNEYCDSTPNPIIAEWTSADRSRPRKSWLFSTEVPELLEAIKRCQEKQESFCHKGERGSLDIFILKQPQHGYTDKQSVEHSTADGQPMLFRFMKDDE
jgi:hypothetical protein